MQPEQQRPAAALDLPPQGRRGGSSDGHGSQCGSRPTSSPGRELGGRRHRSLGRVIVLSRFRVDAASEPTFRSQADAAIAVLQRRDGLLSLDFGRNLDEPELWTLTTRWVDVGSYRRALSGIESKSVVVPMLSLALDEPSAYESPDLVGENWARGAAGAP